MEVEVNFFEVEPEVLTAQGEVIRVEQNTLGAVAGVVGVLRESAAAAGTAEAVGALERFTTVVSTRVDLMRQAVDSIGAATVTSGAAYTRVDLSVAENFRATGEQLAGLD